MPTGLKRYYGGNQLHFITCSCYQRRPYFDSDRRDEFLHILEELRQTYEFVVVGYVLMPEHFHLLIGEPNRGNPSSVMFALKQRTSRRWLKSLRQLGIEHFWQRRFYDFNVFSEKKRIEKLKYIHRNPVVRELVAQPEDWRWSSYRHYLFGEETHVRIGIDVVARKLTVPPVPAKNA